MTNNVVNEIILTGEKLKKLFGFFSFHDSICRNKCLFLKSV